jgi:apolipoprotein N-acyltransferase
MLKVIPLLVFLPGPVLTGILLALAFPNYHLDWLAWLAFVPFFLAIRGKKTWQAFLLGWFCGAIFFIGITPWWIQEFQFVSPLASGLGYLYLSFYFALFGLFLCLFLRIIRSTVLVAAPVWVTLEYLRANLSFLAFPWALLGHTQYLNLPIIQIASFTGVYGVSFAIVMVNAALTDLVFHVFSTSPQPSPARGEGDKRDLKGMKKDEFAKNRHPGESRGPGNYNQLKTLDSGFRRNDESGLPATFFEVVKEGGERGDQIKKASFRLMGILFLLSGIWILGWTSLPSKPDGKPLKVAVVQGNIPQKIKWNREYREQIISKYETLTIEAAKFEPQLIVWPEASTPGFVLNDFSLLRRMGSMMEKIKAFLLVGSAEYPKFSKPSRKLSLNKGNTALLFSPQGRVLGQYLKMRLVPFGEYIPYKDIISWPDFIARKGKRTFDIAGSEATLFRVDGNQFGALICWEVLFPDLTRNLVKGGAGFAINLTNEAWFGKIAFPYQMLSSCVFRAVENRINLVRCANTGISCFIDPFGRVTSRVVLDGKDCFIEGTLIQTIYLNRPGTFYTYFGDILVYLSIGFTVFMLIYPWVKRKNYNMRAT